MGGGSTGGKPYLSRDQAGWLLKLFPRLDPGPNWYEGLPSKGTAFKGLVGDSSFTKGGSKTIDDVRATSSEKSLPKASSAIPARPKEVLGCYERRHFASDLKDRTAHVSNPNEKGRVGRVPPAPAASRTRMAGVPSFLSGVGDRAQNQGDASERMSFFDDEGTGGESKKPRRGIQVMSAPVKDGKAMKQRASQADQAQRRADLAKLSVKELHRAVLSWDFFSLASSEDEDDPGSLSKLLEAVPDRFGESSEYVQVFKPLLLQEVRAQLAQTSMEYESASSKGKLLNVDCVDDFHVLSFEVTKPPEQRISENDVLLISKFNPTERPDGPSGGYHTLGRATPLKGKDRRGDNSLRLTCYFPTRDKRSKSVQSQLHGKTTWYLTPLNNLTTAHREFFALRSVASLGLLKSAIVSPSACSLKRVHEGTTRTMLSLCQDQGFNPSQSTAIEESLSFEAGFSLLQGPPGTGKTKTIVGLVCAMIAGWRKTSRGAVTHRILLCAPSNAAVDEIAMRLTQGMALDGRKDHITPNVVRIGKMETTHLGVTARHLDTLAAEAEGDPAFSAQEEALTQLQGKVKELRVKLEEMSKSIGETHKVRVAYLFLHVQIVTLLITTDCFDALSHTQARLELTDTTGEEYNTLTAQLTDTHTKKKELGRQLGESLGEQRKTTTSLSSSREGSRMRILSEAEVVCCTLTGSGVDYLAKVQNGFRTVVVDEAAQAVELATLIPLQYGCKKCILVGDPNQLPATVISRVSKRYGYERSLFERLQTCGARVTMLDTQYRMHPDICRFPSKQFYGGKLKSSDSTLQREMQKLLPPFIFYGVMSGREGTSGGSYSKVNMVEVRELIFILTLLTPMLILIESYSHPHWT